MDFNSPYMQYYFKRFFVSQSSEVIFLFLIKKSRQKAIEIEVAFFFHSLGYPKGRTLDHFFMLHLQTDTYIDELRRICFLRRNHSQRVSKYSLARRTIFCHRISMNIGLAGLSNRDS